MAFDGAHLWITRALDGMVTKLRVSDGAIVGTFPVSNNGLAIAFDGANVWLANFDGNGLTKLRASDGMVLSTLSVGNSIRSAAFDGANLWISNGGPAQEDKRCSRRCPGTW